MRQQVLPLRQALQVPYEQSQKPAGVGSVDPLLRTLAQQPGFGQLLYFQQLTAVDSDPCQLQNHRNRVQLHSADT